VPRDPKFPYAGMWKGVRTMPMGHDSIGLAFAMEDGKYAGVTLYNGGGGRGIRLDGQRKYTWGTWQRYAG
jgi:hypothetical protein